MAGSNTWDHVTVTGNLKPPSLQEHTALTYKVIQEKITGLLVNRWAGPGKIYTENNSLVRKRASKLTDPSYFFSSLTYRIGFVFSLLLLCLTGSYVCVWRRVHGNKRDSVVDFQFS